MASSEIIAIGSELLLGETQDTNTAHILKKLREIGIDIYRTQIIGDNVQRIANAIRESLARVDIVITTGGLGPTIDDATREAVAAAFGTELIYREELWQDILRFFNDREREPSENNKRQAYLPMSATPIHNAIGTAPAFYIEKDDKILIALPGVPIEMKYLVDDFVIEILRKKFQSEETIAVRTLHTFGLGESVVDEAVSDFETWANPTLGLCAKEGITDLRMTAKGMSRIDALVKLDDLEHKIRSRLGKHIYGVDAETLPEVVNRVVRENNILVAVHEYGTKGQIASHLGIDILKSSSTVNEAAVPDETKFAETALAPADQILLHVWVNCVEDSLCKVQLTCATSKTSKQLTRIFNPNLFSEEYYVFIALETLRMAVLDEV